MRSVIPAGLNGFSSAGLLPFAALHHLINFLFDGFKIERGRLLHRRIIDLRLRQLEEFLLHENEAPELASIETVCVTAAHCLVRAIRAACRLARSPSSSSAILRNHRPRHEHLELFSIGDASLSVRKNAPQRCD
jgi:hypothetical protein